MQVLTLIEITIVVMLVIECELNNYIIRGIVSDTKTRVKQRAPIPR